MIILKVEDITAGYTEVEILHGVHIQVKSGEIVSVIGPNGAGKSTLLKTIFGVLKPKGGKITLKGKDITGLKPDRVVRQGISYVPQVNNVFPSLAIQENLEMGRKDLMKKREGSFLRLLGEVQAKRNESENSIKTLNESIQILKEVENPRQLWQAHCSLASTFKKMGKGSEAQEQWGAASDIIQNTAKGLSDRELRDGFLNAEPIREILSKDS